MDGKTILKKFRPTGYFLFIFFFRQIIGNERYTEYTDVPRILENRENWQIASAVSMGKKLFITNRPFHFRSAGEYLIFFFFFFGILSKRFFVLTLNMRKKIHIK